MGVKWKSKYRKLLIKCRTLVDAFLNCIIKRFLLLLEEIGKVTGIFAFKQVANTQIHVSERILWFFTVIGSFYGAYALSSTQLKRYIISPTVISIDRDYREWNGTLPAVTLCYYDRMDSFKANEYIQNKWNVSMIDDEYFYFMEFLHTVINATSNNYGDLARYVEDERFEDVNLYELIKSIERSFNQTITSYDDNFKVEVNLVMTERGMCYVLNSPMSKILSNQKVQANELKEPLLCQYGKNQCFIKMDIFESAGTIDVHSPFEVSANDANIIELNKADEIIASYKVMETIAHANLRELAPSQRKCSFRDEEKSQLPIYSKTLCLSRCRAIMAFEMCNCVPFFYPFVDGPSCKPAGFECLLDFKWPIWALHICKCPNTCTDLNYSIHSTKKSSWGGLQGDESKKTDTVTSSFRWDIIPPKVRIRRDVLFSFEDLLVSFGGTMALFLGFSFLSIAKMIYIGLSKLTFATFKILTWRNIKEMPMKIKISKNKATSNWNKGKHLKIKKTQLKLTNIK